MLTQIPAGRQQLYDGMEPELWTTTWALPVEGATVTLAETDENDFELLRTRIGDAAFAQVITEGGFLTDDLGRHRAADGAGLVHLVKDHCLFVLGLQEFQPGRYLVTFEAAWRIS